MAPSLSQKGSKQQVKKASQAGFTLVELLVVIGILGILLSIAGGSWSSLRADEQVRAAAEKIRSAMTAARMKALTTGKTQYVGIDLANAALASTIDNRSTQDWYDTVFNSWNNATLWEPTQAVVLRESLSTATAGTNPAAQISGIKTFYFKSNGKADADTGSTRTIRVNAVDTSASLAILLVVSNVTGRTYMVDCTVNNATTGECLK